MIRIKEEPKRTVTKVGGRRQGKSPMEAYYAAPYALTRKVIPEAMYGDGRVTKKPARAVTKSRKIKPRNTPEKGGDRRTGKVKAPSPPPAPVSSAGRPKVHATAADRQRAYRERQKVKA